MLLWNLGMNSTPISGTREPATEHQQVFELVVFMLVREAVAVEVSHAEEVASRRLVIVPGSV